MSVEYDVIVSKSIYMNFEKHIDDWMKQSSFNKISINKTKDLTKYFVFCQGSIRGLVLSFNKKLFQIELQIKINALASKTDWSMLYSLISFIGKNTKVLEEGSQIKKVNLTKEYFLKKADSYLKLGMGVIKTLLEKEDYARLPLWDIDIVISRSYFESIKDDSELITYLSDRAYRYYYAHRAGIIELEGKISIEVWSFNDAIFEEADYIAITRDVDNTNTIFVPWDEFINSVFVKYDRIPRDKDEKPYYFISQINDDQIEEALSYFPNRSVSIEDMKKKSFPLK